MRLLVALAFVPSIAQADLAKGAHVGANQIGIEGDGDARGVDGPFKPALVLGMTIRKSLTPTFSLQLEGNVEQKRAVMRDCAVNPCMDVADISMWYFAVPVLLRFDLLPGATKFHLDAGPELVLSLGGGQTDTATEDFQSFDDKLGNVGLVLGVGLEVATGPGSITFDLRYKRWFAPVYDGPDKLQITHQIWVVTGYVFP